jgi:uncharacterized membrane protein YfcA
MTQTLPDLLPLIAMLLVSSAFAGVLAGLLGVGGGIVLVPVYLSIFTAEGFGGGEIMRVCLATSLATIIATSTRSVMAHHRKGAVDWQILRGWAPAIAAGALVGVLIVSKLSSDTLKMIFAILVCVIALYMSFGKSTWRVAEAMPTGPMRAVWAGLIGFLSVLLGIGGGSLAVPTMALHNVPIHRAVATAAGFGIAIALPSAIAFLLTSVPGAPPYTVGAINLPAFLITISMTLITAPIGASLAHKIDPKPLKRIFGAFLMLVALKMLYNAIF